MTIIRNLNYVLGPVLIHIRCLTPCIWISRVWRQCFIDRLDTEQQCRIMRLLGESEESLPIKMYRSPLCCSTDTSEESSLPQIKQTTSLGRAFRGDHLHSVLFCTCCLNIFIYIWFEVQFHSWMPWQTQPESVCVSSPRPWGYLNRLRLGATKISVLGEQTHYLGLSSLKWSQMIHRWADRLKNNGFLVGVQDF